MNFKNKMMTCFLVVIAGCSEKKSSIAGRYVLSLQNEKTKETDTIVITPLNEKAKVYYFVHQMGIPKILNGNFVSLENKTDSSLCVYNADKKQIRDQIYGKVYSVSNTALRMITDEGTTLVYKRVQ